MRETILRRMVLGAAALLVLISAAAVGEAGAGETFSAKRSAQFLQTMSTMEQVPLGRLKGMTPDAVRKITAFRQGGKKFNSLDEFKQVSGLTASQFDQLASAFPESSAADDKESAALAPGEAMEAKPRVFDRSGRAALGAPARPGPSKSKSESESPKLDLDVQSNYFAILPGYDLSKVDENKRKIFLDTINREKCSCGCSGETLGYCLVNDPGCPVVKGRVKKIYTDVFGSAPVSPAGASD